MSLVFISFDWVAIVAVATVGGQPLNPTSLLARFYASAPQTRDWSVEMAVEQDAVYARVDEALDQAERVCTRC